tara:strand:- start:125 stop:319 length:195 start_codon:yes stop_codon:yes gene_type:complete
LTGKRKPETVSVRIREDTFATIYDAAKKYGVKHVDIIDAMAYCWSNYTTNIDKTSVIHSVKKQK